MLVEIIRIPKPEDILKRTPLVEVDDEEIGSISLEVQKKVLLMIK